VDIVVIFLWLTTTSRGAIIRSLNVLGANVNFAIVLQTRYSSGKGGQWRETVALFPEELLDVHIQAKLQAGVYR
jgi:hypothetical protein